MNNVVQANMITTVDLLPEKILSAALEAGLRVLGDLLDGS